MRLKCVKSTSMLNRLLTHNMLGLKKKRLTNRGKANLKSRLSATGCRFAELTVHIQYRQRIDKTLMSFLNK